MSYLVWRILQERHLVRLHVVSVGSGATLAKTQDAIPVYAVACSNQDHVTSIMHSWARKVTPFRTIQRRANTFPQRIKSLQRSGSKS